MGTTLSPGQYSTEQRTQLTGFNRFLPVLSGFRFSTIIVVKDHQLLKRPLLKLISNTYGGFNVLFSDMEQ